MKKFRFLVAGLLLFSLILSSYLYDYRDYGHEVSIIKTENTKIANIKIDNKLFKSEVRLRPKSNEFIFGRVDLIKGESFLSLDLQQPNHKTKKFTCKLIRPKNIAWSQFVVLVRENDLSCYCDSSALDYQKNQRNNLGI